MTGAERETRLLEENDELRQRVAELEGMTTNRFEFPEAWRLTKSNIALLSALLAVDFVRFEQLEQSPQMISRLRKKLDRTGVEIQNIFGIGYRIPPDDKAKLRRYAREQT